MDTKLTYDDRLSAAGHFIRSLGTLPVLSHQELVSLAQRLETLRHEFMAILATLSTTGDECERIAKRLDVGTVFARELVELDTDAPSQRLDPHRLAKQLRQFARAQHDYLTVLAQKRPSLLRLKRLRATCEKTFGDLHLHPSTTRSLAKAYFRHLERTKGKVVPIDDKGMAQRLRDVQKEMAVIKSTMVRGNMRLVLNIARRFMGRGLQFSDLVQEGSVGLMRAVDKFDHNLGYKFATYATWWIKQGMTRALSDQGRTIRVPVHMQESLVKLQRVKRQALQTSGEEPSLGWMAHQTAMPVSRAKRALSIAPEPLSLELPLGAGSELTLGELVAQRSTPSPAEWVDNQELAKRVQSALQVLTPRERVVMAMRFGLDEHHEHTLEQVAQTFDLTRERIRQIEAAALHKLRHSQALPLLLEFCKN